VVPDSTEGYSIEVFNALGDTIAVTSVPVSALETLRQDEVLCARTLWGSEYPFMVSSSHVHPSIYVLDGGLCM
jgi:hypothetical protein